MKIKNKDFWEKKEVINTQNTVKTAANYERFLFELVTNRQVASEKIESVNIYGCGTGRDIKIIDEFFNPKWIMASDISENMIKGCNKNLKEWKINAHVDVFVGNAVDFESSERTFDLVTLLNSMLTYVSSREDRLKIYHNSFESLKEEGLVIGTVHNQVGRPLKTIYFKVRKLFSFILKYKVGNKNTGFKGYKIPGYYYDKEWLIKDLSQTGFSNIEVYSLEDFFVKIGKKYDKTKGYNQLIFIGAKISSKNNDF